MKKLIVLSILFLSMSVPKAQLGTPFIATNIALVTPCVVGNIGYQTTTPVGLYICTAPNTWTPSPAVVINNATSLPSTCIVGTLFTITPTGALFSCPITDTFVPVAAGIVAIKSITGIQNNLFTNVLTITVPNIATGAVLGVTLSGSLGVGGAIGQYETTTGRELLISITRTPGLATANQIITVQSVADASVVGAAGITQTTQLSAVSGANNATQTFSLQYRITRGSGTSNNHIASVTSRLVSPAPTSITIN